MFTGIIETMGEIKKITNEGTNVHYTIESDITSELKIDQSVSHNGVCLTVVDIQDKEYTVTAIKQTLDITALKHWKEGDHVNMERCTLMNGRLDGHLVQGHVDTVARVEEVREEDGSWRFFFSYRDGDNGLIVDKGSITVNGVSLTVVDAGENTFSVAIIPYTYEHTVFKSLKPGDEVNIEFDIIGKYVQKLVGARG
ncbi:MAG: riboflavin synthase [Flavobacteriales bacterium]|nr:riboflavin synthase [Flavobacteriales bacterium]